jgi:hypothetical protein
MARLSLSVGRGWPAVEGRDVVVANIDASVMDSMAVNRIAFFISNCFSLMMKQR